MQRGLQVLKRGRHEIKSFHWRMRDEKERRIGLAGIEYFVSHAWRHGAEGTRL